MIAACPRCSARYRIDADRLRPEGVRLRCSRCEAVFRVRPPSGPTSSTPPEAEPALSPAANSPPPPSPAARPAGGADPGASPPEDRSRLVLVADPEIEQGKSTVGRLAEWGLQPILVHDGVEAILTIQRMLPHAVVLDAALPKMFGFQVCEIVKRNDSLKDIHVALVGAIHDPDRYRRPPGELYGADAYLERPDLPDGLRSILSSFGLPVAAEAGHASVAPSVAPPVPEVAPPQPSPPAPEPKTSPGTDEEVAKAERLARIVVSDIILYNQEKFDAALQAGEVVDALAAELAEGRSLFTARIPPAVREGRDFLVEELVRVARDRGMK